MSASAARALAFSSSRAGTMSVAPSRRIASAIRRSCGLASKPVRYAMETGRVTYRALTCRFAIQPRRAAIGAVATTDLLNRRDANRVLAARRLDRHLIADAMSDQRLA